MARLKICYLAVRPTPELRAQVEYAVLSALAFAHPAVDVHLFGDGPVLGQEYAAAVTFGPLEKLVPGETAENPFATKLRAVEYMARSFAGDCTMFVDADTFFTRGYAGLHAMLAGGTPLLHRREYLPAKEATGQARKFRRALRQAGMPAADGEWMWNSGVIGLPPGAAHRIAEARERMAVVVPHTPRHAYLAEQFCVSRALHEALPAEDFVFHYWYQKAAYTRAIGERLQGWRNVQLEERKSALLAAETLRLPVPAQKLHWWERLLVRSGRARPTDPRGLPGKSG